MVVAHTFGCDNFIPYLLLVAKLYATNCTKAAYAVYTCFQPTVNSLLLTIQACVVGVVAILLHDAPN